MAFYERQNLREKGINYWNGLGKVKDQTIMNKGHCGNVFLFVFWLFHVKTHRIT